MNDPHPSGRLLRFARPAVDEVRHGIGCLTELGDVLERDGVERAVIITGRSLAGNAPLLASVTDAMRGRVAGVFSQTRRHVPRATAIAAADFLRDKHADAVISFGGSTQSDTAKGAVWAVAGDLRTPDGFEHFAMRFQYPSARIIPAMPGKALPIYALPTTLSAGEFTSIAGLTDPESGEKQLFQDPKLGARVAVLDPTLTLDTPEELWLSSGVKAIDHCVEAWFSTSHQTITDALAAEALAMLMRDLPVTRNRPDDLNARLNCQIAAWCSVFGLANVSLGLSHGLGHQLGSHCDVAHGLTSCALLPPVIEFNSDVTQDRRETLCRRLQASLDPAISAAGFKAEIESLIRDRLGLPWRLRDMGVPEAELERVALSSLRDPIVATNPKPISDVDQVRSVLAAAW